MRKIRWAAAFAGASAALLFGFVAPAPAAAQSGSIGGSEITLSIPSPYHFGTYTTSAACHSYGQTLVANTSWTWYSCRSASGYWELWMYA